MIVKLVTGSATCRLIRKREPSAFTSYLVRPKVPAIRVGDELHFEE